VADDLERVLDAFAGAPDPELRRHLQDEATDIRAMADEIDRLTKKTLDIGQISGMEAIAFLEQAKQRPVSRTKRRIILTYRGVQRLAIAATVLLAISGWLILLFQARTPQRELLLASATPFAGQPRAGGAAELVLRPGQGYVAERLDTYGVSIQSPRDGFATIALIRDGAKDVYPRPGAQIRVEAFRELRYPRLPVEEGRTTIFIIVTASPAEHLVDKALAEDAESQDPAARQMKVQSRLWEAGHRWAAVCQITITGIPVR